jgi:hypothetical protein
MSRLGELRWALGHPDYLYRNMPVIAGFRDGDELPPLVVVENVFTRILVDRADRATIDATINVWLAKRCSA